MRHGFASDGAVTLGMAMGWSWECPQGTSPKGVALPSVTAPALAKPRQAASAMLPSPQPTAVAEEICEKKTFHRLKSFSPAGPDRSIATATNQPEKTFQPLKSIFLKEHHRDVLGKGTSPVIPQSRISEAR